MRIIFSGGGTSGHVNPAIAIANYMKLTHPEAEILFIGTQKGIESRLVPREGYPIKFVKVRGFSRKLTLKNVSALVRAVTSQWACRKIIKDFKPDLVVATGGFVSWPVIAAASGMGIPTALHESNAYPGLTVRMLQHKADRIMICFEESKKYLSADARCVLTGTPVRRELLESDRDRAREAIGAGDRPVLLSCAGSMGASTVNEIILQTMREHTSKLGLLHIHATGAGDYQNCLRRFQELGLDGVPNLKLLEYYDINHLVASDIMISRAGAMTITELAILGKAAILIPSPYVTDNHQYKNAKVLKDSDAALLIEEKDCTPATLGEAIELLTVGEAKRASLSANVRRFADRKSMQKIYYVLQDLMKKKD